MTSPGTGSLSLAPVTNTLPMDFLATSPPPQPGVYCHNTCLYCGVPDPPFLGKMSFLLPDMLEIVASRSIKFNTNNWFSTLKNDKSPFRFLGHQLISFIKSINKMLCGLFTCVGLSKSLVLYWDRLVSKKSEWTLLGDYSSFLTSYENLIFVLKFWLDCTPYC